MPRAPGADGGGVEEEVTLCICDMGLSKRKGCVVRYSNLGPQLLLTPANWCPIFASRTTQGKRVDIDGRGGRHAWVSPCAGWLHCVP